MRQLSQDSSNVEELLDGSQGFSQHINLVPANLSCCTPEYANNDASLFTFLAASDMA